MYKELKSVSLPSVTKQLDSETNESSSIFFVFLVCFSLFCLCVCCCNCISLCVNVCMCVYVPILFSCAHSTGQKTESTATDPSRWSLSLPTWRRTSSAEYFGSTMPHGYGGTGGSFFKLKIICLGAKNKHYIYVIGLSCSFSALLHIFHNFL